MQDRLPEFISMLINTPIPDYIDMKSLAPEGYKATVVVISLLFIITMLRLRNNFYKNDIKTRNYQQVIIVFIINAIACALLTKENMLYKLSIIIIPLSVIVSNYFLSIKKGWWAEILFLILLATMIFNYTISY